MDRVLTTCLTVRLRGQAPRRSWPRCPEPRPVATHVAPAPAPRPAPAPVPTWRWRDCAVQRLQFLLRSPPPGSMLTPPRGQSVLQVAPDNRFRIPAAPRDTPRSLWRVNCRSNRAGSPTRASGRLSARGASRQGAGSCPQGASRCRFANRILSVLRTVAVELSSYASGHLQPGHPIRRWTVEQEAQLRELGPGLAHRLAC